MSPNKSDCLNDPLAFSFEREMRESSIKYKRKTGIHPTRYLQMIEQMGGVAAAIHLALDPHIQTGLQKAAEYDCVELTSEYLIVHGQGGKYAELFPDHVKKAAAQKLKALTDYRDILRLSKKR